jgi:hypothetical protein
MFPAADSEVLFLRIGALAILTAAIISLLLWTGSRGPRGG